MKRQWFTRTAPCEINKNKHCVPSYLVGFVLLPRHFTKEITTIHNTPLVRLVWTGLPQNTFQLFCPNFCLPTTSANPSYSIRKLIIHDHDCPTPMYTFWYACQVLVPACHQSLTCDTCLLVWRWFAISISQHCSTDPFMWIQTDLLMDAGRSFLTTQPVSTALYYLNKQRFTWGLSSIRWTILGTRITIKK